MQTMSTAASSDKKSMKGSSTEHVQTATPRGVTFTRTTATAKTDKSSNLSKPLSKSHDNLASTLRRKAVAARELQQQHNTMSPGHAKFKTPKPASGGMNNNTTSPIRKAQSQQHIDKACGELLQRTQSAQCINRAHGSSAMSTSGSSTSSRGTNIPSVARKNHSSNLPKRAVSTQNIAKKQGKTPPGVNPPAKAQTVAYNAELLASFEKEKRSWERRISELTHLAESRKTENERLKYEVKNLKARLPEESVKEELELVRGENKVLREKLHELGATLEHSTDNDKLCMLSKRQQTAGTPSAGIPANNSTSTPATSAANQESAEAGPTDLDEPVGMAHSQGSIGDLSWITPEHPSSLSTTTQEMNWEKGSNKSDALSEVSVACLQDRILQMEESHYSTSEELQATLQELGDLQDSVNELSDENDILADERSVLLESLCAQTEKLENCRMQIDHLKALLVNDSEKGDRSESERLLTVLVKSGHEEKEELQLRQVELSHMVSTLEAREQEKTDVITALKDKICILEAKHESLEADRREYETQVTELREARAKDQIDLQRYSTLLQNQKHKVAELEQFRAARGDKSDLESLLENARCEKEALEEKLTNAERLLAVGENTVSKLQETVGSQGEQMKVIKNNAKTQVSDLEYALEKKDAEIAHLREEAASLREHIDTLQLDCDRYLEEKSQYSATLTQMETDLKTARQISSEYQHQATELRSKYSEDQEEWRQFQADLQKAVVIANDFKMETQEGMEKLRADNQYLSEMRVSLEAEIERLKAQIEKLRSEREASGLRGKVISSLDRELANLRTARKPSLEKGNGGGTGLSVKNIIHTIEEQVKCVSPLSPTGASSRRSSTDSSNFSFSSKTSPISSPTSTTPSPLHRRHSTAGTTPERRPVSCPTTPDAKASPAAATGSKPVMRSKSGVSGTNVTMRGGEAGAKATDKGRSPHRHTISGMSDIIYESAPRKTSHKTTINTSTKSTTASPLSVSKDNKNNSGGTANSNKSSHKSHDMNDAPTVSNSPVAMFGKKSILKESSTSKIRRGSGAGCDKEPSPDKPSLYPGHSAAHKSTADPLTGLAKEMGGSKRNALLTWCKKKTLTYSGIDITNFSSSWNDGLAFCALVHSYLPKTIPYTQLTSSDKHRNFTLAFKACEEVGIPATLSVSDMVALERPDWNAVMNYVTSIYKHFEVDNKTT